MGIKHSLPPCLLLLIALLAQTQCIVESDHSRHIPFSRRSFPKGFVFGTASAAYQYEGAVKEGGRSPSIWDNFTHTYPERISDGSNGDVAVDFYHRYKEDVKIMKDMNTDALRFSISWSRVLPGGKLKRGVNKEGIRFYNNLINELLANGLQPFVTIFHWDVPQALEDDYGGLLSSRIVDDFRDFAELCFKEFGDRVKHWITLNEPNMFTTEGYDLGNWAPGRCSKWVNSACEAGNSATEPYIVGHNLILSHAAAVELYKQQYQAKQRGQIGVILTTTWLIPYDNSKPNIEAAKRGIDFNLGWFMEPVVYGDYPFTMRKEVGKRLPKFSQKQSMRLKRSFDFIGLNYYTTNYAVNIVPIANSVNISYSTDSHVYTTAERGGIPIGPQAKWIYVYPKGLLDLLTYSKKKYDIPVFYITENGVCDTTNATLPQVLKDPMRINYHYRHLLFLQRAIKEGVNVKGYFVWSLLDNFEWASGYTMKFGMNYIDYSNGLKRHPRDSAKWFKNFLKK
ncbi:beta-glucosidase 12-like isoform X1 [Pistacia vera]|uniref:beta-glucosidase 12-like isoform X1 n=1 Tax=Pistacia vera TaxID=55513 RepID=UPI001262B0C4|nr:beta-glucosidase 12-like isoform X1 [Pistacia vera]